jgi:hypothetical protein
MFTRKQCEACLAREANIARLMEENRELRNQLHEVISSQKDLLRGILHLDTHPTEKTDMTPIRKVTSIGSRLKQAEIRDREEYNKRIEQELATEKSK